MTIFWESKGQPDPLSVTAAIAVALLYLFVVAGLTILTHVSLLLGIPFRTYAWLCALVVLLVGLPSILWGARLLRQSSPKDVQYLVAVLLLGIVGAFLAIAMHRTGRISPDEYYSAANPVYYIQHPDAAMSLESHLFYSRSPVQGSLFLSAGAYEYIQSAVAFLGRVEFAKVYYVLGAGATGFLIPVSIFLLVYCFSRSVPGSAIGAFVTMVAITLMGETSWAPGANSFVRAFEGKALLQFAGVPLLAAFSLRYFVRRTAVSWLSIFALCIALAGSSTSSFAIAPILGFILAAAYILASGRSLVVDRESALHLAAYFSAFLYLAAWALFVAQRDGVKTAIYFNQGYPSTFLGYVDGFIYSPLPLTPILAVSATLGALLLAKGKSQKLLLWWTALALVLILNPFSAQILLNYFKGIYYRLFYLLPFPVSIGLVSAYLYGLTSTLQRRVRLALGAAATVSLVVLPFVFPVSVFRLSLYAWGNTFYDPELVRAAEVLSVAPSGVMLAPYPLSGAMSMLDSDHPQMLTRPDLLDFYLGQRNQQQDALLRSQAQAAMDGNGMHFEAIAGLLDDYPEIHTVVLDKQAYLINQSVFDPMLRAREFVRQKVFVSGTVIFSR